MWQSYKGNRGINDDGSSYYRSEPLWTQPKPPTKTKSNRTHSRYTNHLSNRDSAVDDRENTRWSRRAEAGNELFRVENIWAYEDGPFYVAKPRIKFGRYIHIDLDD